MPPPPAVSIRRACSCSPRTDTAPPRAPRAQTVWDPASKKYAPDSNEGSYGAPFYDTVDTEWDKKWMGKQPSGLQEAIINGYLRIGRDTTEAYDEKGADLTLPLPINDPKFADDFGDYLKLVHPDHGYIQTVKYEDT